MTAPIARVRASWHDWSGNRIAEERERHGGIGLLFRHGHRFCESCQRHRPKGSRPAVKGWRCGECFGGAR